MRLPTNPDAVLWQLLELHETLSSPRSFSALRNIGLGPVSECVNPRCRNCGLRHCQSDRRRWDAEMRLVCACCGKRWQYEVMLCGPGEMPGSRRTDLTDLRFAQLGTLIALVHKPALWERRAWFVYLLEGRGLRGAAERCQRRWPRAPFAWNKDRVYRLVASARATVERELLRARLEIAA